MIGQVAQRATAAVANAAIDQARRNPEAAKAVGGSWRLGMGGVEGSRLTERSRRGLAKEGEGRGWAGGRTCRLPRRWVEAGSRGRGDGKAEGPG